MSVACVSLGTILSCLFEHLGVFQFMLAIDTAIRQGDCVELMRQMPTGTVDLAFADPPFNIGYDYDAYHDEQTDDDYLDWSRAWMEEVHRLLTPTGSFWLAIGDEYAADLKVVADRQIGFTTRSWVIWYYTFGVNCKRKFSRSHVHLFHFVKDPDKFTFNADDPAVRVPSARALVYGDKRANPTGRLPDDTWILRPQDFQSDRYGFDAMDDTWYFSRVAGTFKERQGFQRLSDARATAGTHYSRQLRTGRRGVRPLRRQRNHARGGQEARSSLHRVRTLRGICALRL